MINRKALSAINRLSEQFPVIAVTGPRQSGKTTLTKAAFPNKQYVSLDDRRMREIAASDPGDFLKAFPDGAIIDEAQKVPALFDAIKLVVDSSEYTPVETTKTLDVEKEITAAGTYYFAAKDDAGNTSTV